MCSLAGFYFSLIYIYIYINVRIINLHKDCFFCWRYEGLELERYK